jgi:hypothetical protein
MSMENLPDDVIRRIARKLPMGNKERMRAATKNLKKTINSTKAQQKAAKAAIYGFKEAKAAWVVEVHQNIVETARLFRELIPANNFERHEFVETVWRILSRENVIIVEVSEEEMMFMAAYLIVLLGEKAIANFTIGDLQPLLHTHKLDSWMNLMRNTSGLKFPESIYIQIVHPAVAILSNAKAMRALDGIRPKLQKIAKLHRKFVALQRRHDQMEKDLVNRLNDMGNTLFSLRVREHLVRTRTVPDDHKLDEWWGSKEEVKVGLLDYYNY